ncbi:PEP-CTERM sorting domain-containing protein [Mesorhizobium koreense]|uniref:PEP-CTERM sorting domain-containing protein n=1 Tax=Mesorhizobium koreense TaxID=3074855 RepID=UPI00287B8A72|nr:PEP-CTERM sorting domain-containing protein [Mesorhizobium sp. WR6]
MRRLVFAVALAASVAISTAAGASTTLSQQNNSDVFDGGGHATVSNISNRSDIRASAGGFRLTDGTNKFVAWCLDVLDYLSLPGKYDFTIAPFTNREVLSPTKIGNIQSLFDNNYSDAMLINNNESAGFQMALWELIYETGNVFDVRNGEWSATAATTAVNYANSFLGNLGASASQHFNLTFYQSLDPRNGYGQNLVSATPVPLPATAGLLAFGLLGLFGLAGRRKLAGARS